jgi:hypothetical protein
MQLYHLYVGQLESYSLSLSLSLIIIIIIIIIIEKACVCKGSCDCGSHLPLVLRPRKA